MVDAVQSGPRARLFVRVAVQWCVDVRAAGWLEAAPIDLVDLSEGGAYLRTGAVLLEGEVIEITFPSTRNHVDRPRARARVARVTREGVGVAFVDLNPEVRQWIRAEVERAQLPEAPSAVLGRQWWAGRVPEVATGAEPDATNEPDVLGFLPGRIGEALPDGAGQDPSDEALFQAAIEHLAAQLGTDGARHPRADQVEIPAPNEATRLHQRAIAAMDKGDHATACALAEELQRRFPDNPRYRVLFHLAAAAILKGHGAIDDAVLHWEDALAQDPSCMLAITELRQARATRVVRAGVKGRFLRSMAAR